MAKRAAVATYTSSRARRVVPDRVAFGVADAAAALARRKHAAVWQDNVRFFAQLLAYTPLRGSEQDVATEAVAEYFRIMEIFWRPWLMERGEIAEADNFHSVHAGGRRVVFAFPHFGLTVAAAPTLRRAGIDAHTVLAALYYDSTGDSYAARVARRGRAYIDELGAYHHDRVTHGGASQAKGTFARMQELLESGQTVGMAWSLPGSMPTPFLGRELHLASGPAKLAVATDAVVVPMVNERRGSIPVVRFGAPIDPRDCDGAQAVQAAIARQMEIWALQHPEAVWPLGDQKGGPPLINGPAIASEAPSGSPLS